MTTSELTHMSSPSITTEVPTALLDQLRPRSLQRIMDLVSAAGVDTREWSESKSGAPNPKFCYEWAFVEPDRVVVVNLAHRDIAAEGDRLFQNIDIAELERRYAAGNSKRMKRLEILAQALELAFTMELPVRAVIFDGDLADENSTGPTRVTARELDPIPWAVTERSGSPGMFKLTRGASPRRFVDQFTVPEPVGDGPSRRAVVGHAFERSVVVRQRARQRAGGKCELCGCPGFTTSSGEVYLETHHIVPLSESGLDIESNVIALCPNHHREAHFGESRGAMRTALLQLATPRARPR